jgi:hypothetical protein
MRADEGQGDLELQPGEPAVFASERKLLQDDSQDIRDLFGV